MIFLLITQTVSHPAAVMLHTCDTWNVQSKWFRRTSCCITGETQAGEIRVQELVWLLAVPHHLPPPAHCPPILVSLSNPSPRTFITLPILSALEGAVALAVWNDCTLASDCISLMQKTLYPPSLSQTLLTRAIKHLLVCLSPFKCQTLYFQRLKQHKLTNKKNI